MIIRVCLAAAVLVPAAALAQGNPGPYGKLFGRAPASSAGEERTTVEVRSSIGANYDSVLLAPEGSPSDAAQERGMQGSGSGVLSVAHRSSAFIANLSGGAGRGEYFTQPAPYGTTQYFANVSAHAKLSTRFEAGASAAYVHSPSYEFFSDFGRGPVDQNNAVDLDSSLLPYSPYAVQMLENERVDAAANLVTNITQQSTIDLSAYQHQTRFAEQPDDDVVINGYRATWQWRFRRDLGVHAGYGQEHIDLRAPERLDYDSAIIDIGVDFNRQFSVARRTTLGFATSTSFLKHDAVDGEFRFNGGVSLSKLFRRTWQATVQASRTTSFVPGFAEPLYSDTVSASLGGMISTRLEFLANASGARGESSFSDVSGYSSFTGMSRLSFALGNHVSAYASYYSYWYEVPVNAFTLSVPGRMARQVVSAGLSFYVPIYEKVRQGQ